jgi:NADH dehydrogenase [ubiquinone] 1 alpha subcomplex assembly factor 5
MRTLSPETWHRTSAAVTALFDMDLRALRRDRAARSGPELFLFERAFADCLERLALVRRRFKRALLIGCPDPAWPRRLVEFTESIDVRDTGPLFAQAAGGVTITEDEWTPPPENYDLIVPIGTLDTVNDLPRALLALRIAMAPDGLLLGAMSGGDTLPQLRRAMHAADTVMGAASPHIHPRIEAAAVAPLLSRCGFANPVIDVDRAQVSYASMSRLVDDLRRMAATNVLTQRSERPLSRRAAAAAARNFAQAAQDGRTIEIFEILHFAAWTPPAEVQASNG